MQSGGDRCKLQLKAYAKIDVEPPENMRGRVPMMVSIRAPSVMAEQREPVDIVVVLHVRAGCKVPGYWQDLLMEAVQVVTSKLRDEDRLSVIPSGGTTRVSEDPEQRLTVKYMEALLPMSDKNKELYSDALSKAIQKCDNPLVRALEMADSILYGQSYENAEERRAGYIIVISNNADDMGSFLTWRFRSVLAFGFRDVHNARTMHTIARSRDSTYAILDDEHGVISQAFSSSVDRIISAVTAMPVEVRLRCCEQKEVTLLGVDGPHISYFISYDKKEIWASAYLYGVVTNFIVYLSLGVGDHRDQVLHKNDLRDRFTVLHVKHRHVQGMLDGQVVTVYNGIDGSKEVAAEIVRIEAVKIVAEFTKGDKSDSEELHKASDELCAQWTNLYRNREATEAGDLISGLAAEMKEMEIRLYNNYLWLEYMLSWKSHQWWQLPLPRLFMDKQDQVVGDSLVRLTIFAKVDTISGTTNVTESQQQLQSQKKQWSQQQDNVSGTVTESKQEEEQQQQQQHQHKQDIVAATVTKSQQQREPQKQHQQQQDNVTKSQPQQDTVSGTVKESQQQHEPQKQQEEEEDNVEGTVTKSEQQQQQPQQQQNQQQQRQQQEDIVSRTVTGSQQQQQLKQRPQKQQQEEQRQQRLPVLVRIVAPETGLAKVKRAPVDLVVVMDASWGATEVEKKSKIRMEQLTEAMELIIEKLSHKDRLAIVPVDVQSSSSLPEHASRLLVMSKQGKSKVQSLVNQVVSKSPLAPADNKVELPLPMQTTHWREKVNKAMELIKKRLHIAPVNSTSDPTPTTSSQSQRRSYWTSETSVPEPTAELRTVEGGPPHRQPIYIPRNNRFNLARNNRFDLAHLPPGVSPESPNFDPPIPFAHPTHWPKLRRPEHRQLSTEGGHGSTILGEALADAMQILKHAEETNQEDRPGFIIVISNSVENISMNSKHTVHAFSFYNSDTRNTRAMHDIASGSGIYGSLHDRRDQISQAFTVCINKITSTIGVKTTVHISWSHSSSIALSAIQSGKLDYRIDKDKKSGTIWAGALHAGTVKNFMLYLDNVREEDHVNLSKMLQVRVEWLEAFDGTKEKLDGQVVIVKEEDEGFMEVMAQMARAEAGKIVGEIAHPRYDMVGDRLSKCLEAAKKAREAGDASLAREMEMMKTLLLRKLERMAGRGSMEVLEGIITVDPHYVRKLVEDRLSYMLSWLSFQDLCLNKHPGCHNF